MVNDLEGLSPYSREWYEDIKESAELRDICILILNVISQIVFDPSLINQPEERARLEAQLEPLEGLLIDKGIRRKMNMSGDQFRYATDPVFMAQYLAGQILDGIAQPKPHVADVVAQQAEFNEGGEIPLIKAEFITQLARNHEDMKALISMGADFLDAKEEISWS